ncbi:MAG: hypothetical protein GY800_02455 [Planctomycetes bacterium]|nr:hypothetical protein [Planctomycetota bacterium]
MRHLRSGFTLIDIVVILAVFGVLLGTMIPLTIQIAYKKREAQTIDELDKLRTAVIGDPLVILNEARTQFGYVGDMGNLPASIEDLYKKGVQPAFSFNTTKKTGAGWDGPYVDPNIFEHLETLKTDGFGNDFDYTTTPFTDATTGALVEGQIRSKGKDGTSSTSDDLSLDFFNSQIKSKVFGFIKNELDEGVGGVTVTLNYPSSGVLTTANTPTDATGFYTFDDAPYGNRSLTLEPNLVLAAGTPEIFGSGGQHIRFSVTNFSSSTINITKFKATYTSDPQAFYTELRVGGTTVYNSTTPRLGSGDTTTFSAIPVAAGTGVSESTPIQIQAPVTEVADINISVLGRGATIVIEMRQFKDAQTGSGSNVDMTGVTMEVVFNEGLSGESTVSFIPY